MQAGFAATSSWSAIASESGIINIFANPLPELVTELRSAAYPHLAENANHWAGTVG